MSERFFLGNATRKPLDNERGSTTSTLLLVLLLVLAAGGYLFYFTDLIRPAKKAAIPQAVSTTQVKTPIPPRPDQPGGSGAAPVKPGESKPTPGSVAPSAGVPQPTAAAPPAKSAAEPKPLAATAVPVKPETLKTAKTEPPLKSAPIHTKVPSATTKPAATKSAATKSAATKSAAPVPTKPAKKETVATKTVKRAKKPAGASKTGIYTLLIGDFVPGQLFVTIQAKLKKSGITPVKIYAITTTEPMNRIFIANFTDQDTAEAELQKLKKLTADAFLVVDNGTYNLYAGSYFSESRLNSEVKRLTARGIKPVVKKAQINIKVKITRVTAGSFESAEEAAKAIKRFKKQGISTKLIKIGK
jgi:cell division protein FtsN